MNYEMLTHSLLRTRWDTHEALTRMDGWQANDRGPILGSMCSLGESINQISGNEVRNTFHCVGDLSSSILISATKVKVHIRASVV